MGLKVIICYQSQYKMDIKTEKKLYIFFFMSPQQNERMGLRSITYVTV